MSFCGKTSGIIAKCWLFSQATVLLMEEQTYCISLSFQLNSLNLNVHSCTYKRYDHFVHWDNRHCHHNICSWSSFHLNHHTLILRILLLKIYNFLVEVNINSTTGKYCAVTLPSRVSQLRISSTQKLKLVFKYLQLTPYKSTAEEVSFEISSTDSNVSLLCNCSGRSHVTPSQVAAKETTKS